MLTVVVLLSSTVLFNKVVSVIRAVIVVPCAEEFVKVAFVVVCFASCPGVTVNLFCKLNNPASVVGTAKESDRQQARIDRQEGGGGESRSLVGVGVDDGVVGHQEVLRSRGHICLDTKIPEALPTHVRREEALTSTSGIPRWGTPDESRGFCAGPLGGASL